MVDWTGFPFPQHVLVPVQQAADRFSVNGKFYLNADKDLEFKAQ